MRHRKRGDQFFRRIGGYWNGTEKIIPFKKNRMICGVCGGLAEYFNIDATIVRLACVLFGFTGTAILVYFIAAVIMPEEPDAY